MLRSMYIAATGMLTQRSKMDVITNNIANIETVGYKSDDLISRSFADMMLHRMEDPNVVGRFVQVGPLNTGVHIDEIVTTHTQGVLEPTGSQDDLAIAGNGFFAIQTDAGERYTRAGNFNVTQEGMLVDVRGNAVLDVGGTPVYAGTGSFTVDAQGVLHTADGQATQLRIAQFQDEGVLRKEGDNLYAAFGGAQPQQAQEGFRIIQQQLELSNVDIAAQLVDMLITNRAYETNQRALNMINESLGLAVNQIAKF